MRNIYLFFSLLRTFIFTIIQHMIWGCPPNSGELSWRCVCVPVSFFCFALFLLRWVGPRRRLRGQSSDNVSNCRTSFLSTRDQDKQNDAPKLEPITFDQLKATKEFVKLKRKQQKELDSLTKKQAKEKQAIQKQQTSSMEKMVKQSANKLSPNDHAVQRLVKEHAEQWCALKEKHAKDYFKLLRYVDMTMMMILLREKPNASNTPFMIISVHRSSGVFDGCCNGCWFVLLPVGTTRISRAWC